MLWLCIIVLWLGIVRPRLLNDLERVSTDESSTVQVVVSGKVVSPLLQVHPALSASFPFFSGHLPGSLYFSTLSTYLKTSSLKNISWVTLSILLDHREGKEKWQSGLMALANKRDCHWWSCSPIKFSDRGPWELVVRWNQDSSTASLPCVKHH